MLTPDCFSMFLRVMVIWRNVYPFQAINEVLDLVAIFGIIGK